MGDTRSEKTVNLLYKLFEIIDDGVGSLYSSVACIADDAMMWLDNGSSVF